MISSGELGLELFLAKRSMPRFFVDLMEKNSRVSAHNWHGFIRHSFICSIAASWSHSYRTRTPNLHLFLGCFSASHLLMSWFAKLEVPLLLPLPKIEGKVRSQIRAQNQ